MFLELITLDLLIPKVCLSSVFEFFKLMAFTSFEFFLFLPVVFLLYWLLCNKSKTLQNGLLVLASLFFYGYWDWRFLGLLLVTALSTYGGGLWLSKTEASKKRWWISFGVIVLNLGILVYYKYTNFFIQSFVDMFRLFGQELSMSTLKIILPVGISFYTFTALSYSIDVYQKKVEATKDVIAYLSYVTFFSSILSGPISRATKQLPQYFQKREFNRSLVTQGLQMLLWGLFMKLCVADRLGIYVDAVYNNIVQHNGTTLFFTSVLYTIQIYADFAGYSLMAIGSGKLFGIELQTNFIRPYFAKTVTEFWRRWHISLTTWFRDYVYFPLGGNRVPKARWIMNIMAVFLVSGVWHGAAYTFIIWGGLHGLLQVAEKLLYGDRIKQIPDKSTPLNILRILITFNLVSFAWIFFRADGIDNALLIVQKIFTTHGSLFVDAPTLVYGFMCLALLFVKDLMDEFFSGKCLLYNHRSIVVRWSSYIITLMLILLFGAFAGGSFIYFQF